MLSPERWGMVSIQIPHIDQNRMKKELKGH